jgi:Protein of unknown function (DUF2442)
MRRIVSCSADDDYNLMLRFDDGVEGRVCLRDLVGIGMFSAWRDIEKFKQVSLNWAEDAVSWESGIDLSPEVLYDDIAARAKHARLH